MGYYTTINGKKYDGSALDLAERLQRAAGDGRLSVVDSKKIARALTDKKVMTRVEDRTANRLRQVAHFTDAGRDTFNDAIRNTPRNAAIR